MNLTLANTDWHRICYVKTDFDSVVKLSNLGTKDPCLVQVFSKFNPETFQNFSRSSIVSSSICLHNI
jgi:hypothetical protein